VLRIAGHFKFDDKKAENSFTKYLEDREKPFAHPYRVKSAVNKLTANNSTIWTYWRIAAQLLGTTSDASQPA
jgi:hypothetical protein